MLVTACLIVKDEAEMLAKTLPNLVNLVDEIILVDTGSSDNTIEIAKKIGAKVYGFKWIGDFSAARNESIKYAQGEWILWVDADEYIQEQDYKKLKQELTNSKEIGYQLKVTECREGELKPISFNLRPKLFKNNMGIHFERPINEQPYTKDGKALISYSKPLDIPIFHWGCHLSKDKMEKKKYRNLELLKKAVENGGGDEAYHFLLGTNYKDLNQFSEAIKEFEVTEKISKSPAFVIAAKSEKAWALYLKQEIKLAYLEALEVVKLDPDNSQAWNIIGAIFLATGETQKAIEVLQKSSSLMPKKDAIIVNIRPKEYVANLFLSKAYLIAGKKKEALEAAEKVYRFDPTEEAQKAVNAAKSA